METEDWESFLFKALVSKYLNANLKSNHNSIFILQFDDYLNEELHLKLIRTYLKIMNLNKAFKHIFKLEAKWTFSSNSNWYASIIELIESKYNEYKIKHENTNLTDETKQEIEMLNITLLVLINHFLLAKLKQPQTDSKQSEQSVIELFIK